MYFCQVSTFGLFELTIADITNMGVLSPVRVELLEASLNRRCFFFKIDNLPHQADYAIIDYNR